MKKIFTAVLVGCLVIFSQSFAFSDVSEDYWAYDNIMEMYQSGIVSGFNDGTFKPNDTITREQSAAIMTNFFEITLKEEAKIFEDLPAGYWSEPYVNLVSQYMPIDEVEGKYYFRPFDNAKRIEVAETIIKIIGYENDPIDSSIIDNFKDSANFSENDKKYIALVAKNGIMVGDDKSEFRPNDTITRAEFCALIYNIYLMRDGLKAQNSEKIVMTVNGEEVSYDEFNLYFKLQRKVYESMFGSSDIWSYEIEGEPLYEIAKESTKDGIVSNKIRLQKAHELNVSLSDEAKKDLEEYADSDIGFEICEFYGINQEELLKINGEGILINELMNKVYNTLDHSAHDHLDISKPVDTIVYSVRHILLSTEGLSDEEKANVKEEAEALLIRVNNGEEFADLAKEYSVDGGSKDNGGLYEDVYLGEFVPEFEEAALSINTGEIYPELVESTYGYHIIKLENKTTTVRDLTDTEKQSIIEADFNNVAQEWFDSSNIEVNEEVYEVI